MIVFVAGTLLYPISLILILFLSRRNHGIKIHGGAYFGIVLLATTGITFLTHAIETHVVEQGMIVEGEIFFFILLAVNIAFFISPVFALLNINKKP